MTRRAYIQGASRGIGWAVAARLAAEGTALALGARRPPDEAVARLLDLGAPEVAVYEVDVRRPEAVRDVFADLATRWDGLEVLVNVAAPPVVRIPWHQIGDDRWQESFETGALGALRTVRAALPLLQSVSTARVVNVSALSAKVQAAGIADFSAAKAALNSISKSMSLELAPQVLVNVVSPGPVMSAKLEEALVEDGLNRDDAAAAFGLIEQRHQVRSDLRKVATPDEIAAAICFLCSEQNTHVTGINLPVDGGSPVPL